MFDDIYEVTGLGKGLGAVGAKMSKSAGMPGLNVGSNVKAIQPEQTPGPEGEEPVTPGEAQALDAEIAAQGPEMVQQLPDPEPLEYDKMGSPDKHRLVGHVVRRDGKEYVLDWDQDYDVYKLVDPETMKVKTRVKPASVSTVDFRSGTIREALQGAIFHILAGDSIDWLVDVLVDG